MWRRSSVFVLAVLVVAAAVPAAAQSPPADAELARMLRSGGVVIVVRHGATNEDEADTDPLNPDNVAKQRHLSPKGEAAAKALGSALNQIGMRISTVITSQ